MDEIKFFEIAAVEALQNAREATTAQEKYNHMLAVQIYFAALIERKARL